MTAPEKIFATVEYIGKTDTVVCGAFGTYPMDESVEFTRTDLSQAAVAAALEAAAVIAETHQVYQAHVCASRIRALITPAQHDALAAANARADQARDAALVEAKAAVGLVRVPVGSTGPIWDAMDAIDALRDKPAPAQCCMCGKTDLSTVEGDGGPECQLDDGRWTCSHACYDRATEEPAPGVTVRAYLLRHRDTGKEEIIDAKKYNPTKLDFWVSPAAMASVEIIPLSAIAGGGDE